MGEPWKRKVIIEKCTLYLGDCAEIIPHIGKVPFVVTDPPYGIGAGKMSLGKWRTSRMAKSDWDATAPEFALLSAIIEASGQQIIWGGNYFDLPPTRGYLVWDKGAGFRGRDFAECEFAWTSIDMNARMFSYDPLARGDYRNKVHPTQKPVTVMSWCLSHLRGGGTVLDPFMGSGSTGVACVSHGSEFIGIEMSEAYFDIACERIRDAHRQTDIFGGLQKPFMQAAPSPVHEQSSIFGEGYE